MTSSFRAEVLPGGEALDVGNVLLEDASLLVDSLLVVGPFPGEASLPVVTVSLLGEVGLFAGEVLLVAGGISVALGEAGPGAAAAAIKAGLPLIARPGVAGEAGIEIGVVARHGPALPPMRDLFPPMKTILAPIRQQGAASRIPSAA